jgi:hypothetical protein
MVPWQRLVDGKTPRLRKIQPLALDLFVIRQDYCFRLEWSVTTCGRLPPPYEYAEYFARNFRRRLEQSDLLFVLLIRNCGIYWERVGSGLMIQEDWPSISKGAEVRAYQERIVLV